MDGMTVPTVKPFYVNETAKRCLLAVAEMSKAKPRNVLVKGMQGCGKSELSEQFAARLKRPYASFQVGLLQESGQLFGQQTLRNNNVEYQQFLFTDAIQVPHAVVNLDEINRAENPKALNALFSVLDDRRKLWLDELKKMIPVAEGVIFFATINEGASFTGTDNLDAAISDRFYIIEMGTIPPQQEKELLVKRICVDIEIASKLVDTMEGVRRGEVEISTRKSLDIAELVKTGLSIRDAFTFTLNMDKDTLERILLSLHLETEESEGAIKEVWTEL